jgi:hypothetical protein
VSRKRQPKFQRERVITLITRELRRLAKRHDEALLDSLLSCGVGWIPNFTARRSDHEYLGRVLIALLPIASVGELEHVADATIHRREVNKGVDWDKASVIARRVLAPLGVRYAACGCLERYAGDQCCGDAVKARAL